MKTLIVCTHCPVPELTGGDMRTMHFARFFRDLGSVDIAYTFPNPSSVEDSSFFRKISVLSLKTKGGFNARFFVGLVTARPIPIYQYDSKSRAKLKEQMAEEGYDFILFRCAFPTGALFDVPKQSRARVLVDLDDNVAGTLYDQYLNGTTGIRRRALEFNRLLLTWHEHRCLRIGIPLVCQEFDRDRVAARSSHPPILVPNIYRPSQPTIEHSPGDGYHLDHRLLFVGTLRYPPNAQGLTWFLENVFPEFCRAYPSAALTVVGRNPPEDLRTVCDATPNVQVRTDVDDVLECYEASRAVIVPLLAGGGTRIKILEAAHAMRPVLSTAIGAEGLALRDGHELLLFESAGEFLKSYRRLLDEDSYRGLCEAASASLKTNYSIDAFSDVMASVVDAITTELKGEGRATPERFGHRRRELRKSGHGTYRGKRLLDLTLASTALLVSAPLWPLIAVAIRIDSPGGTLHRAERAGKGGNSFTLLKFRSMRIGPVGPGVTAGSDPRITRVGALLRRSKLDELPQFINVLRGEMSIVGPRPEDSRYVAHYTEDQARVLDVRPGITGAAAVAFRYEEDLLAGAVDVEAMYLKEVLPAKLALELAYIDQHRFRTDLHLLFRTVRAMVGSGR